MNEFSRSKPIAPRARLSRRTLLIVLVVVLAGLLRLWAAWQLPPDADEPVYLNAGRDYAALIKAGDWRGVVDYEGNREHPPLVKLVYALPYLVYEPVFGSTAEQTFNRLVSALFGTLAVLVFSLIDPLAGAFLAFDSMVIKYTSQVYLESIPLFASLLAVYALQKALRVEGRNAWFWLSAGAIGAAGAGKYLYVLVGVALLIMLLQRRRSPVDFVLYLGTAGLAFWALNPALWVDPVNRLWQSLTFHAAYTGSADVLRASYPWYQVVNWITAAVPWHANVFFFPTTDILIFILLFFGVVSEARTRTWSVVWMVTAFLALLLWPTKWPQYTLVLIPAMCLAASTGVRVLLGWFREFDTTWHWLEVVLPRPSKLFMVAAGIFLAALLSGKLWYEFEMAAARKGWTQVLAEYTPLPGNSIYDIAASVDGAMVIATSQGVVVWKPDDQSPWGAAPEHYLPANSGLAHKNVRRLLLDRAGNWWFGTQAGLSMRSAAGEWRTYRSVDLGLQSDEVLSLAEDMQGQVWVGSMAGAAYLDSSGTWTPLTASRAALPEGPVFDIAVRPDSTGQEIWFASANSVTSLKLPENVWKTYDLSAYGLGWEGVSDLLVDQQGRLWAATLGDGISLWDGQQWQTYRTSNSAIPGNAVTRLFQQPSGLMWLGMAYSTEPGGFLAAYDGANWRSYSPQNSGFSGGEPSAVALDAFNRVWIGTQVDGISIFMPTQPAP